VVDPMLVAELVPDVLESVALVPELKLSVPAMAISKYEVKPLLTSLPHTPDSVPVVMIGRFNSEVGVMVMLLS